MDEYLIDLNATQAAIRSGYSKKTAKAIGQENLTKPDLQALLRQRMKERQDRTEITQDTVLQELIRIGTSNITDYLEYKTAKTVIGRDDDGEPIIDYAMIINAKDSAEVEGAPISEVSLSKDGTFKFKLHDKVKALELIGRHLGMYTDRVDLTAGIAISFSDDYGGDDDASK